ncbi:nod factor export ATP-binding protein i [Plakobranchus ocellatus]|uniref:Nod factor export ATP-binding protein i n=1 Tax=Plakobranchus ocellatus TaxID=259542 RepID=A0AAV3YQ31_9GAST|nr:nod factor export ATP-binding protein i [Plakobranchus ocellatus]
MGRARGAMEAVERKEVQMQWEERDAQWRQWNARGCRCNGKSKRSNGGGGTQGGADAIVRAGRAMEAVDHVEEQRNRGSRKGNGGGRRIWKSNGGGG